MKRIIVDCFDCVASQVLDILYNNQAAISSFAIQDVTKDVKSSCQDV